MSGIQKLLLAAVFAAAPCVLAADNAVLTWNRIATDACLRAGIDPLNETRVLAITQIAVHDALNSVQRRYEAHTWYRPAPGASADAAVAAATHHALTHLLPGQRSIIDAELRTALGAVADGPAKDEGVNVGRQAAAAILQRREGDGASAANFPVRPGTQPGEYRPTFPDFTPAALAGWGRVEPFAMRNGSQFRPPRPYRLDSSEYAADYNEVRGIGEAKSAARTPEQSEIARYWYENCGQGWNRIARSVLNEANSWSAARALALLNIAMADGFIGGFEAKYHYNYWRPQTAIREGGTDGNADTPAEPNWTAFLTTPPVPDYPSTHSVLGAAAATAIARALGTDFVSFEMTSGAPFAGITRKYWSLSEAAEENAASRVLAGIHFRNATVAGVRQGNEIAAWIADNTLRPVR